MTRTLGALLLLVATALVLGPAPAQDAASSVLYLKTRQLRVPFNLGPGSQTLSQLNLYVSTDAGRSWRSVASAPPDQGYFRFDSERDGTFWFNIQQIDKSNQAFPPSMDGKAPMVKVIVDSTPPQIVAQPLAPRANEIGIAWTVRDDNYNINQPDAIRVDYRSLSAGANWQPLIVPAGGTQFYWSPSGAGPFEVRIQARDQAGNVGETITRVSLDGTPAPPIPTNPGYTRNYDPAVGTILNPPAPSDLKLVNSKRINLGYDIKDVGPSRISTIDLFITQDGRTWTKHAQPVADEAGKNLVFEVDREGLYGITLLAKSGVGLGERPPQTGDRPQAWIEVDLTKPVVAVRSPLVGQGVDKGKLKINWTASDKNLGPACITLKYSEQAAGPWNPIAEKLANTGDYTWLMPAAVPFQFYVKVEAIDRAGNLGEDATTIPVKVDLSIPKAIPLTITPAN